MDVVDQLNDYYTTRSKSWRCVMVALSYMMNTARVNEKTVWCLKNDSNISSTSSYDFSWNLAKVLALPQVQKRSLNGLASSMLLKIKMFYGTTLLVKKPVPKVERRFTGTIQRRRCQLHMANSHTKKEKGSAQKRNKQFQSCGISISREHSMQVCMDAYNEILFYISYSLCFAFRLSLV